MKISLSSRKKFLVHLSKQKLVRTDCLVAVFIGRTISGKEEIPACVDHYMELG